MRNITLSPQTTRIGRQATEFVEAMAAATLVDLDASRHRYVALADSVGVNPATSRWYRGAYDFDIDLQQARDAARRGIDANSAQIYDRAFQHGCLEDGIGALARIGTEIDNERLNSWRAFSLVGRTVMGTGGLAFNYFLSMPDSLGLGDREACQAVEAFLPVLNAADQQRFQVLTHPSD